MTELGKHPKLHSLEKHVIDKVAHKWEELAFQFGFDKDGAKVAQIRKNHINSGGVILCCREAFLEWLRGKGRKPPSWRELISCLEAIECNVLVENLRKLIPESHMVKGNGSLQRTPSSVVTEGEATALEKFAFLPELKRELRAYQHELAVPGLSGLNYIICAPTGSGKTMVAAHIIAEHLQQRQRKTVLFVVDKVHLAAQQKVAIQEWIHGVKVVEITGVGSNTSKLAVAPATSTSDIVTEQGIRKGLRDGNIDVLVTTAGYIQYVMQGDLSITNFSLMVIDECHHTNKKHPYAQIMLEYLTIKEKANGEHSNLPQVVGLTASPGAGGANTVMQIRDNLIDLCAHLDAFGGICTVTKHQRDLYQFRNRATHGVINCEGRNENEDFILEIEKEMQAIENIFLKQQHIPHFPRASEAYRQRIAQFKQSVNVTDCDEINAMEVLRYLARGLNIYMDLDKCDAIEYLEENTKSLPKGEPMTEVQCKLQSQYCELVLRLQAIDSEPNPLLLKLEEIICTEMLDGPATNESKAIVIVETQRQARSIFQWIKHRDALKDKIVPHFVVGQGRDDGMTKVEQVGNIKSMKVGDTNLLVATSILEEGVDIPKCNLVIRYQRVSNDIATVQVEGRARAENSTVVTIVSSQAKKDQEYCNQQRVKLIEEAVALIPSTELLMPQLEHRQKVILSKKECMEHQTRPQQDSASNVKIECKFCRRHLCYGSDLRIYNKVHHLVIDPAFESQVKVCEKEMKKNQMEFIRTHDIFCNGCNSDIGVMGIPSKRDTEKYFALARKKIQIVINGQVRSLKNWKDLGFTVEELV
jgi:ERCC4-related helicase